MAFSCLTLDSTGVMYVLINVSSLKLTTKFVKISKHRVHEYASGSTSTPKAQFICNCKRRKCIGQDKVKILSVLVKILVALVTTHCHFELHSTTFLKRWHVITERQLFLVELQSN